MDQKKASYPIGTAGFSLLHDKDKDTRLAFLGSISGAQKHPNSD
jgi:hypothetical protein